SILITGESGTGKEVVARAIHSQSNRRNKPFIAINCAAIPEALLESELFGYSKGAFSGANNNGRVGKFELANGGIIFLDEIGDMPLSLQVKLLRVLQERKFSKIGSNKMINLDIRVIAATNKDIKEMIKEKKFREDLYYRINVIPIEVPNLSERKEDIRQLVLSFIDKY
ncbi:sigma-54 factor interaction domain-containing protein, partial [Clostridium perfringens]